MLRLLVAVGIGCLLLRGGASAAEVALPLPEERVAQAAIRSLRDAARSLKRLSREAADEHGSWLGASSGEIDGLAARWASALDYFGRDFPHDALRADPERLAYAKRWLGERNDELAVQADALLDRLLAENRSQAGEAAPERVAAASEALEEAREAGSGSA